MVNYLTKRVAQAIATVYVVVTLTFGMVRLLPGGPADYIRAQLLQSEENPDTERINAMVEVYTNVNPEKPVLEAYVDYIGSVLMGDFGRSVFYGREVSTLLAEAIPWTVLVISISIVLTYIIGLILGAIMAYAEGSRFDLGATVTSIFLTSVPYYVFAVLFIYLFAFQLEWFPTGGRMGDTIPGANVEFITAVLHHAALPIASLVLAGWGGTALAMRGNSISTLGSDYVRVGRLRGLSERRIALRYVGRNSVLPLYTSFMISVGYMFGGSVILESLFEYIGVGYYLFQSVSARDYPLMMGTFILLSISVVLGILVADLTYSKIDPRIKQGERNETY